MKEMTRKILFASLRHRKGRVMVCVCAITLGSSLIVAAVNLRQGIKGRLAEELRKYGANLVLVPVAGSGPFLKERGLSVFADKRVGERILGYVPFVYKVVKVQGKDIVLAGTRFSSVEKVHPWWQMEGRWPKEKDEALVGSNVASKLGLSVGDRFVSSYKDTSVTFSISGILRTGGAEEHQLFAEMETVQLLTGSQGLLSSVLISHRAERGLDETAAFLRRHWPEAEVKTLWQVAQAEETLLSRIEIFLALVGLVVVLASGFSVFATMTLSALERKVEIALMRALGAEEGEVAWIFASEAVTIGVIGGFLGSLLGFLFAEVIGLSVFRSFVLPSFMSLPAGLAVGLGISLISSLSVMRRISGMSPAVVLRGE
jgi:putative ABC transport system permease protein